jgi:DNA recombination protein RmuC
LYDKFVGFAEDMGLVGEHLKRSQNAYDGAMNKLTNGNGNLVGRAERMRKLGLDNKKTLSKDLIADQQPEDDQITVLRPGAATTTLPEAAEDAATATPQDTPPDAE